ncbi:hypothetical protein MUK42_21571 [Musa troglodytarum]|uniref:Uncharacterized protein n=1 Tax=Musa troglodytarum TaxID=320322 RepID=A0A9E7GCK0_9LILI|nr:hypothetical protein MUK42_21571 [Musa troglodytarum]
MFDDSFPRDQILFTVEIFPVRKPKYSHPKTHPNACCAPFDSVLANDDLATRIAQWWIGFAFAGILQAGSGRVGSGIKALNVRFKAFGRIKRDPAIPDSPQLLLLLYTAGVLRSSFSHFLARSRDRSIDRSGNGVVRRSGGAAPSSHHLSERMRRPVFYRLWVGTCRLELLTVVHECKEWWQGAMVRSDGCREDGSNGEELWPQEKMLSDRENENRGSLQWAHDKGYLVGLVRS